MAAKGYTLGVDVFAYIGEDGNRVELTRLGKDGNVKYVAEHKDARKNDDILTELAKLG